MRFVRTSYMLSTAGKQKDAMQIERKSNTFQVSESVLVLDGAFVTLSVISLKSYDTGEWLSLTEPFSGIVVLKKLLRGLQKLHLTYTETLKGI